MLLDIGSVLDNISTLLNIPLFILPTFITFVVILLLIYLSFRMQVSGLFGTGFVIALYTGSMALLSVLGIESPLNIFDLVGEIL